MNRYLLALVLVAIGILAGAFVASPEPALRIGTFDKRAIVVAYYRSPLEAAYIRELTVERDAAKKAGDTKRVQELEAQGAHEQDLAHQQLAGEIGINSFLARAKPAFAEAAAAARVAAIVESVAYAAEGVEAVDVTEQILVALKADEKTRQVISELRAQDKKK